MAKKFLMPRTVKIGGIEHKVLFPYKFDNSDEVGSYDFTPACIKVADKYKDQPRDPSAIHQSFMHEITHGIDTIYCGINIDSEADIDRFATGMYDVLVNNVLNLQRDNYLPKKIVVCGSSYEIIYPYKIEDSRNSYVVNFESRYIKLYGEKGVSPKTVKHSLIGAILQTIRQNFSIEDPFNGNGNGNGNGKVIFGSLTSGFHQVLVDNNIEKIIKSGV